MHIVPATTNPLGVKGVGEAATTGAIATVMSAVDDAIAGAPGALMEMPATAEKVWKAIRAHGRATLTISSGRHQTPATTKPVLVPNGCD